MYHVFFLFSSDERWDAPKKCVCSLSIYFYHYRVMSSTDSPKLPISKQLYYFNQSEFLAMIYVQLAQSIRTALNIEI